jgi:putative ABC transport system permease protein
MALYWCGNRICKTGFYDQFFKVAIRNLTRNKTFTTINILGLALGTLCCLYIIMYVNDQSGYDRQHKSAGHLYRINTHLAIQGETPINNGSCSPPIAPTLKKDFPEVEQFTRIVPTNRLGAKQHILQYGDKNIFETDAVYADSTFFDVFSYHFVYGNAIKTLDDPYCVVLLKPTAGKLFGNTDPVGKTISINNGYGKHDFKVTAVIDESLGHSHIKANLLMSMNSGSMGGFTYTNTDWAAYNYAVSYIRLRPNANVAALENKLPALLKKYGADRLKQMGMRKELHLQALTSIHTTGGYKSELSEPVDRSFLHLLLLIAILIQVIACINFMNLSTAHASKRAKEVGVRKVIGAQIKNLVIQFVGESLLLSCCGVLLALPLLVLLLPYFNQLTKADIHISFFTHAGFWLLLAGIMLLSGLLSGSFPAFYLSAFKPVRVLKGNFTNHLSAAGIRRVLVVFQFVLSILLISGIIVIYSQLSYIKNKDVGFNQHQQIILNFYTGDTQERIPALCNDLRQLPEVTAVSQADNYPSQEVTRDWLFYLEGSNNATGKDISFVCTDEHYAKALGMTIMGGRDFREGDSGKVLLNETGALIGTNSRNGARETDLSADRTRGTRFLFRNSRRYQRR